MKKKPGSNNIVCATKEEISFKAKELQERKISDYSFVSFSSPRKGASIHHKNSDLQSLEEQNLFGECLKKAIA